MASKIERLIDAEEWPAARRAIRADLKSDPENHWLLTRLGLTYYEEKDYGRALECASAGRCRGSALSTGPVGLCRIPSDVGSEPCCAENLSTPGPSRHRGDCL